MRAGVVDGLVALDVENADPRLAELEGASLPAVLLGQPARPVQLVVAGKSHPADDGGKRLIQLLVEFSQDPEVRGRIKIAAFHRGVTVAVMRRELLAREVPHSPGDPS